MLCERHAVAVGAARVLLRASGPGSRTGPRPPWTSSIDANAPAVGRWGGAARVACGELQHTLHGVRGAAPAALSPRCAPGSTGACVRVCVGVCSHESARGRTLGVWAGVRGGWHRERGAAATQTLQQRSAVTTASAGRGVGRKNEATAERAENYRLPPPPQLGSVEAVPSEAGTPDPPYFLLNAHASGPLLLPLDRAAASRHHTHVLDPPCAHAPSPRPCSRHAGPLGACCGPVRAERRRGKG